MGRKKIEKYGHQRARQVIEGHFCFKIYYFPTIIPNLGIRTPKWMK